MNPTLATILSILLISAASTTEAVDPSVSAGAKQICVVAIDPSATAPYTVIKQLKIGKGSYGSVDDAIAMLADKARESGADAVINYTGSQRFGFWPWRFVHPVVRGTAVKWNPGSTFDCVSAGGSLH